MLHRFPFAYILAAIVLFAGAPAASARDFHASPDGRPTGDGSTTTPWDLATAFVRPNRYEHGRAHVAVYNWQRAETIEIDVSDVLERGDRYRLVNAQDFFGEPLLSAVYDGRPLRLAMQPRPAATPAGMADFQPPGTEPVFGAYVLMLDDSQ